MKLTRRQEEFISNLHELNRELDGPIHYSLLAERLGVSPFTAYDMLCLLEEKGFVCSEYQLASGKSGPGRAERVFYPTDKARAKKQRIIKAAGGHTFSEEGFRKFVLEQIRLGEHPDNELSEEMLARIPPEISDSGLRYCMEIMTVINLRLRSSNAMQVFTQHKPGFANENSTDFRTSLFTLAGFAFGILVQEYSSDQQWVDQLREHVNIYTEIVFEMNQENILQLREFVEELFARSPEDNLGKIPV
jgi:DNA-binding PadR family transcriptional regulator